MKISSIRHTGFVVRDLKRSLKFYCGVLGLEIYKRQIEQGEYIDNLVGLEDVTLEWVKLNVKQGNLIELLQYKSHPDLTTIKNRSNKKGSGHLALTVDDLDSLYKTLMKKSYICKSPPLTSPNGKIKILYCYDPDGIIIEFIQDI